MSDHISRTFDQELDQLRRLVAEMGGLSERMLADATIALVREDTKRAQSVIATDPKLDELQRKIEDNAVLMLMRRQPVANDLREVMASIRIAHDLERIGDLAKNIAKRSLKVQGHMQLGRAMTGVEALSRLAQGQLKDVLDAYAQSNDKGALDVWGRDGQIDALENSLFRELLTYMMEDPRNITFCTHLLFCAKNIERLGDHTTNIAETVHFVVTGRALPADRPRGDSPSDAAA
ncbi:MAG: phosphate signaling complex protein PhoU [Hyphomicrobiales bacterium]|jgi:phosphate transport system protein|nr:phosphate signaling complex protein PhoU [Hyphomicrobiales bacterium]